MSSTADRIRFAWILASALPVAAMAQQHGGHTVAPAPSRAASAPVEPKGKAQPQPRSASYSSAFDGYRPFSDEPAVSWRDANDAVARIGGWRVYAREAQEPAAPDRAASQPRAQPDKRGGHGAHKSP